MKTSSFLKPVVLLIFLSTFLSSCLLSEEDPGSLQSEEKDYALADFSRLEMGDAFTIKIQQGAEYSIHVSGDRRNLDDLRVRNVGATLKVDFDKNRNRKHTTYFTITMPKLESAYLSGATTSDISGFKSADDIELILAGASVGTLDVESKHATLNLSGASKLTVTGKSDAVVIKASGASELHAFSLPATAVDADASGASKINVFASRTLKAIASGASTIYYRGNPSVNSSSSGASQIKAY